MTTKSADALAEYDADRERFERARFFSFVALSLYEVRARARRAARPG